MPGKFDKVNLDSLPDKNERLNSVNLDLLPDKSATQQPPTPAVTPDQEIGLLDAISKKLSTPILSNTDLAKKLGLPDGVTVPIDVMLQILDTPRTAITSALPNDESNPDEGFLEAFARSKPFGETSLGFDPNNFADIPASSFTGPNIGLGGATVTQTLPPISGKERTDALNLTTDALIDVAATAGLGALFKASKSLLTKATKAVETGDARLANEVLSETPKTDLDEARKLFEDNGIDVDAPKSSPPENAGFEGVSIDNLPDKPKTDVSAPKSTEPVTEKPTKKPNKPLAETETPKGVVEPGAVKIPKKPVKEPVKPKTDDGIDLDKVGRSKLKNYPEPVQKLVKILQKESADAIEVQRRGSVPIKQIQAGGAKLEPRIFKRMSKGLKPGTIFNAEETAAMARVVFNNAPDIIEDVIKGIPNKLEVGAHGVRAEIGRALRVLSENPPDIPLEDIQKIRKMVESLEVVSDTAPTIGKRLKKVFGEDYGKSNTVVTVESADKARAAFRKKMGNLQSGLDPESIVLAAKVGTFHIEAGARSFAEFSSIMVKELGQAVKPHLKEIYAKAQKDSGIDAKEFTDAKEIDKILNSPSLTKEVTRKQKEQIKNLLGAAGLKSSDIDPAFIDKFVEFATAIKLTGISTQVKGVIGNTSEVLLRAPEKLIAGSLSKARSALTGVDQTVHAREALAEVTGIMTGMNKASKRFWEALKDPDIALKEATKAGDAAVSRSGPAIKGKFGQIVNSPFRVIGAVDVFFKELHRNAETYAQVARKALDEGHFSHEYVSKVAKEVRKNPDEFSKITEAADLDAKIRVFQEDIEGIANIVNTARRKYPLFRLIFPFYNTPVNLMKRALRRTPGGTFILPSDWDKFGYFSKFRKKAISGEDLRIARNSPEFYEMIAQQITGGTIMTGAMLYGLAGGITGGGPRNKARKETLRATGWQPYSIVVDDTYVSYRGFEPLSTWLRVAGDVADGITDQRSFGEIAAKTMTSYMKQFAENPFLTGMNQFQEMLQDPEGTSVPNFLANMAVGSTVPVIYQQWSKVAFDPVVRKEKTLLKKIQSKIPPFSKGTQPIVDIFGQPVERFGRGAPQALGFTISPKKNDKLSGLLRDLKNENGKPFSIGLPSKTVNGVALTDDEFTRYRMLSGAMIKQSLDKLISSPEFDKMDDGDKFGAMSQVVRSVRKIVRHQEFSRYYKSSEETKTRKRKRRK